MSHIKERQVEYFFRTAEIVKYLWLMFSSLVFSLKGGALFSLNVAKMSETELANFILREQQTK